MSEKYEVEAVKMSTELLNIVDPLDEIQDIHQRIVARKKVADHQYLKMGYDLFTVHEDESYKKLKYETFADYVWGELGIPISKADSYRRLWRHYTKELGVSQDQLEGVGVSRAVAIRAVVKQSNKEEWINKAKTLSWKELKSEITKEQNLRPKHKIQEVTSVKPKVDLENPNNAPNLMNSDIFVQHDDPKLLKSEETLVKKEFFLYPEQLRFILTALQVIEKETGSSKEGYNLASALHELLATRMVIGNDKNDKPLLLMRGFEQRYGGRLLWCKTSEQEEFLNKLVHDSDGLFNGSLTTE